MNRRGFLRSILAGAVAAPLVTLPMVPAPDLRPWFRLHGHEPLTQTLGAHPTFVFQGDSITKGWHG